MLEHVGAALEDLAGRRVEGDEDVGAGLVAGRGDAGEHRLAAPPRWRSRSGAKPPSSPTAVARPFEARLFFSAWKTSTPTRRHSEKVAAPAGTTMNSWKSTELSAWAPPLSTFIIGTGSRVGSPPP